MSTEKAAPQGAGTRLAKKTFNIEKAGGVKQPVIDKIEVAFLKIDESHGVDCDPYNSTGQFLVDDLKKKSSD